MEEIKTTNEVTEYTLKVIDKLFSITGGEQLYRREIGILFNILELLSKPMFITKNK